MVSSMRTNGLEGCERIDFPLVGQARQTVLGTRSDLAEARPLRRASADRSFMAKEELCGVVGFGINVAAVSGKAYPVWLEMPMAR